MTRNVLESASETIDPTVSIVIPVHNGGDSFRQCLQSVQAWAGAALEVVVVVDGGSDDSAQQAIAAGAKVMQLPSAGGPARARNLGATLAQGDILFFIDADVTLQANTLSQVVAQFRSQPDLAALIGSYDDAPGAPNFLSQYKNLFHHYTHQTGAADASTFWGACGAIRREVFLKLGGFDEAYRHPSVEDIELGYRLKRSNYPIQLCKTVQVKHLKRWQVGSLLRAEFFYRALPWTLLIWRDRQFVNDLNLKQSSRVSLLLSYGLLFSLMGGLWHPAIAVAGWLCAIALIAINLPLYQFFAQKRGLWFAIRVLPWHWLYFLYGGLAFALGTLRYHLIDRSRWASVVPSSEL